MTPDFAPRPLQIDVGQLVQRTVASLYSSLVTRQTGRAVRLAIESQLAEVEDTAFSLIDLSEVTILDFSCADEVVAKLLQRYLEEDRPREAFFIFRGDGQLHRDPMEAALDRQRLAAVMVCEDGSVELVGTRSDPEWRTWRIVEERGRMAHGDVERVFEGGEREAVEALVRRRLVFRSPRSGALHALSRFVADLP